jgi:HlyD family secretion protein
LCEEGDLAGDTLAIWTFLKSMQKTQAEGALTSANAQYNMAVNGATDSQIKLQKAKERMKEQYEFAQNQSND